MTASIDTFVTAGEIGRILRTPYHRVMYILNTRPHIRPVRRAGMIRLFDATAVDAVRQIINDIDSRRVGQSSVKKTGGAVGVTAPPIVFRPQGVSPATSGQQHHDHDRQDGDGQRKP